jgi:hypothetical protein
MKINVNAVNTTSSRSPVVQCTSHSRTVCGGRFSLDAVRLDRSARFPHPLDHLRFGETRVIKGHRHHTAKKRGPRPADAVDLLHLVFQLLLPRARGASVQAQNRPAVLLVPERREFLGDVPHPFLADQPGIEVDCQRMARRVNFRPHDAQLIREPDRREVILPFTVVVYILQIPLRHFESITMNSKRGLCKDWRLLTLFCAGSGSVDG